MAEMLDVYDEHGNWIEVAERAVVHAKGLWHHTVHCWLVRQEGEGTVRGKEAPRIKVLFQQRSANKDTNPSLFDITAAGHLEAGESTQAIIRELEEELGVRVTFDQLTEYGVFREQDSGVACGIPYIDAEVSHVYGLVTDIPLMQFRLQEEEVSGLYEADVDELIRLMEGTVKEITAQGVELCEGKLQAAEVNLTCSSFVLRDYSYYIEVFKFLRNLVKA